MEVVDLPPPGFQGADSAGRAPRRTNAFPADLLEFPLQENLRNTRRISALTQQFYQGPPMRTFGPEGQDVAHIVSRDASEIERQVGMLTAIDDLPAGEETALL